MNGLDYSVLTPQNKLNQKKSFIGNLVLAEPLDGCQLSPNTDSNDSYSSTTTVIIAQIGECHPAQKVKSAEIVGAKMLLLVLRRDMELNHPAVHDLRKFFVLFGSKK